MSDATRLKHLTAVIVDHERALAEALATCLARQGRFDYVSVASGRRLTDFPAKPSSVVVVGVDSDEEWDPLALLRALRTQKPRASCVALSRLDSLPLISAAIRAGAVGWVSKQTGLGEFAEAILAAARWEAPVPPSMLRRVLRSLTEEPGAGESKSAPAVLTGRERQVLAHTAHGSSRREIAAQLQVSIDTVRTHMQHVLSKLGVHTTLEAVSMYLRGEV